MFKTKLRVRPFIPFLKDEEKESREPYAQLVYGGVTIEIDLTILRSLNLNLESSLYTQANSLFSGAIAEMQREMWSDIDGKISPYHRDADPKHPIYDSITHNPLHPDNVPHVIIT